jgi:hypothetical protein
MRSAAELKALRAGTVAFIAANPVQLTLTPRKRITSGTGTTFQNMPARNEQTLCLIDQSTTRSPSPGVVQTSDGRERLVEFVLLGRWDAKVELWDTWTDANGVWEVAQVFPDNGYELRAAVVRHA